MNRKRIRATLQWYTMDLHLHTPASSDYQLEGVSYLDILRQAEKRGLDIIAFTDHNTVAGYRGMREEIEQLELLERLNRLHTGEKSQLAEYRRLLDKILVLPGFEFTATFGFHILGIFPPDKPVREIEHILLDLEIPADQLDDGSVTVGASSDVLTAYREINAAGGLVIAAHANTNNGVAMRGFSFGGQTKIAYTQDRNLHALEVTDLEYKGRRTTAAFFNGTKPEYPRRMHCIQGSDAHRLETDPQRKKNLGVGDRATEVRLEDVSFEALLDLFLSNDFARTRPHSPAAVPAYDFVRTAREEGATLVQDFHESMTIRGGKLYAIIADVCAFANTNGGTLYVGLNQNERRPVVGVPSGEQAVSQLNKEISKRISPQLECTIDVHTTNGKQIVRILVPRGEDTPYAVDDNKIYIRTETETGLAVRDEIVELILRGQGEHALPVSEPPVHGRAEAMEKEPETQPRTGVEIVEVEERDGVKYYTMRDLRNGNVVKNVTEKSARKLWHQAITRYGKLPADFSKARLHWQGNLGVLEVHKRGARVHYDLVQRTPQGYRYYFGVTEDGIHGAWKDLVGAEDNG
ncbi:MAG: putative DNA binding domain-containing protein [Anaerolineales bacterium]|nr:putative DNA binding domain-containing protein [Anaerolineales bacterium]